MLRPRFWTVDQKTLPGSVRSHVLRLSWVVVVCDCVTESQFLILPILLSVKVLVIGDSADNLTSAVLSTRFRSRVFHLAIRKHWPSSSLLREQEGRSDKPAIHYPMV
jgi:hypothetical protein